jgi:hypothetical protein
VHRRVGKINGVLTITNILCIYLSFYRCKMPRQYAFAVLRRPSPPPTLPILLPPTVITPKEFPEPKKRKYERYTITQKIQALTLLYCTEGKPTLKKYEEIERLTGIGGKSLRNIAKRARDRGFDCEGEKLLIEEKYIADVQRSDAPKIAIRSAKTKQILNLIRQNRSTRQYFSKYLTY